MASVRSLWTLRNPDSRFNLALKIFSISVAVRPLSWTGLFLQCRLTSNQSRRMRVIPNLNENDLIIKTPKQDRRYEKTKYSAKVSNKSQRASDALLSNVKPNGKQLNWVDEARRNGKQNGRGGSDRQTAHDETGNGRTEMLGERSATKRETKRTERKCWAMGGQRGGEKGGLNGNIERVAPNETWRREITGEKRASKERRGCRGVLC